MAVALVQTNVGVEGTNTGSVTLSGVGAGNLLVYMCSFAGQDATPTISATNTNTFTVPVTQFNTDGSVTTDLMGYCLSATAGSTTVQMSKSETDADCIIMEFSGVGAFDKSGTGSGFGTTATPSYNFSPSASGELIVAHFAQENKAETSVTPGTGFTTSSAIWNLNHFDAAEYILSCGAGTITTAMTVSPTAAVGWCSVVMAFTAASGVVSTIYMLGHT